MSAIPTLSLSYTILTAIALQILLLAPAAPSPSPPLNNFNIQFDVNNNYGGRSRADPAVETPGVEHTPDEGTTPSRPISSETTDKVEHVFVNEDLDVPEEDETGAIVEGEEGEEEEKEGKGVEKELRVEDAKEGHDEKGHDEKGEPTAGDGNGISAVIHETRIEPPKIDELLRADTNENVSKILKPV